MIYLIHKNDLYLIYPLYNLSNMENKRAPKVKVLERNCTGCRILFKPKLNRTKYCSLECCHKNKITKENIKGEIKEKNTKIPIKQCLFCKKDFQPKRNAAILCSIICSKNYQQNDEYKNKAKIWGIKAGKASAKAQQKRSKNEVYFSELCEKWFGSDDIKTNETMFDGWDADVIILSKKIAVLWNGVWHYKQISKSQSLCQVQTRDSIKLKVIEKNGYIPYVICDMGKYNPSFVESEFELFLLHMIDM